jgi:hypothetical protein
MMIRSRFPGFRMPARTFRPRNRNVKGNYATASVIADRIVYQNCSA